MRVTGQQLIINSVVSQCVLCTEHVVAGNFLLSYNVPTFVAVIMVTIILLIHYLVVCLHISSIESLHNHAIRLSASSTSTLLSLLHPKKYQYNYRLYAKKSVKKSSEQSSGKGFLKKSIVNTENRFDNQNKGTTKSDDSRVSLTSSSISDNDTDDDVSKKTELLLKKYNIGQGSDSNKSGKSKTKSSSVDNDMEESPFGQKVLARIPMKLQRQIDNTLITVTFVALLFVVLCGIGNNYMSIENTLTTFCDYIAV